MAEYFIDGEKFSRKQIEAIGRAIAFSKEEWLELDIKKIPDFEEKDRLMNDVIKAFYSYQSDTVFHLALLIKSPVSYIRWLDFFKVADGKLYHVLSSISVDEERED